MPMITPFDVFSVTEISEAINVIPNNYGRLNEMGLLPVKGVALSEIAVEEKNGVLAMIPTEQLGGPGVVGNIGKRKVRTFKIPKLIYDEHVTPQEVANVRAAFGSGPEVLADVLNEKLETARMKHDITLEHLRVGAIKGNILDADGTTVIYDLYSEFGITEKVVDFVLGTAGTDVPAKCREVVRHIEDNLLGEVMSGVRCLVSPEFYDGLVAHDSVKEIYLNWSAAQERLGGDLRSGFTVGGITFEEYRGNATGTSGNVKFIPAGDGRAFPVGTTQTFRSFVGPGDFNDTIGKLGQLYYARTEPSKHGRGYDVHTQSNPLPMCMRPAVLVRVHSSN